MGSRLKQNPERTFYWFFEATCPVARDRDPGVQFSFPEDFTDEESCQTLPRFCFPYDIQRSQDRVAVQHFTFALTDLEGCQRFGFCRLANTSQTCLCILSHLPWFEVFYKLLNNLADYLSKGQSKEARALLAELHRQPVPLVSGSVTLSMGEQVSVSTEVSPSVGRSRAPEGVPYFIAPDPKSLPSIPENRNLTELIVAVDVGNLLQLYASLLFERRILIFASKLSTLTSCVHALSAVLYPMYWQHIFIPVLPPHLLDYCCAPMPYLIGVHSSLSERVKSRGLEEVIILNVDTNTLESPFDDFKRIPPEVMSQLKMGLKRQAVSPGCGVSRAFLRAQALLFGGYREALHTQSGETRFDKDFFLDHKSNSMRDFLQSAVHLQSFKQFLDSRLDILNQGQELCDLFEEEIRNCEESPGRSRSYQQLVGNIRKGGGALILNVKSNMKAKGISKTGLKNLLAHKGQSEDLSLQRGGSLSDRRGASDSLQDRLPLEQHISKSRPHRPVHRYRALRDKGRTERGAWDRVELKHDSDDRRETEKEEEEEEEDPLLCDPEEMDLLGEIFDTLSSRSFHDRGVLYGTRSLDLFGPDSHDFITKQNLITPSQESLCTTEDPSDLTEDGDKVSLDTMERTDYEETERQHQDTPNLQQDIPDPQQYAPDPQQDTPDLQQDTPDPQQYAPDPQQDTPDLQQDTPDPQQYAPDLQQDAPDLQQDTPDLQQDTPDPQQDIPDPQQYAPDPQQYAPDPQQYAPDSQQDTPNLQQDTPDLQQDAPDLQQDAPDPQQDTPDPQQDTPDLQQDTPDPQQDTPDLQQDAPDPLQDEETRESEEVEDRNNKTSSFLDTVADVPKVDGLDTCEYSNVTNEDIGQVKLKTTEAEMIENPQVSNIKQIPGKIDPASAGDEAHPTPRPTPPPPTVLPAAARYKSQAAIEGPDLQSRLKTLAEAGGSGGGSGSQSEQMVAEKDRPPVNVSELKKRFEA